ncbi:unnamed protein product [Vitrella brassicaformis CCMP3155]|uniref:Uncharacterized protein n=2 Tax=Vitrella brassicaformis TaxID=1169539 RepID=A0A0G4ET52_VITBC|nr:unnamed protein product [Vitrella brassicaformis CCMP3155]|eukprot:CEM01464.1 unnamed protein product [Vitrella brassicaformis CCMP3155]
MAKEIALTELEEALEEAGKEGKTPLFLDTSGNVDTYLSYRQTTVVEAKKCLMDKLKGTAVSDIREGLRSQLVNAMRYSHNLLIRMTNSAVDFLGTFCEETTFPVDVFDPNAILSNEVVERVIRDSDKKAEDGRVFVPRGLTVVITSTFEKEDYAEFLKDAIPLDKCMVFYVKKSA